MKQFILLLCLLPALSAHAQKRQDKAVFFPVVNYPKGSGWGTLDRTKAECDAIASDLASLYGFETQVLPDLSKAQIEDQLVALSKKEYGPEDQLLLYFSMHGQFEESAKGGSLVPFGGTASDPRTWLLHAQLDYYVSRIPCAHILIAIDACYSGTFSGVKAMPLGAAGQDCASKIKNALNRQSRLYLCAGGKETVPAHSDFARRWRSALGSRGGEDGLLSFVELQLQLSEALPTPKWGTFSGDQGGSFVFVPKGGCGAAVPVTRDPDLAAIENARRQNSEEIWQLYLDTWAKGRYRNEAHQALYRLQENRVWQAAQRSNTSAAYQNYVSIYCPGGQYCGIVPTTPTQPDQMVLIPGGTFKMGSTDGESDEKPVHEVTLSDFYMAKYELTVAEFRAFVEDTGYQTEAEKGDGSYIFKGTSWEKTSGISWRNDAEGNTANDKHPVIHVSWNDAMAYCTWLSEKTKQAYRLPTEAEWEYAAGNGYRHTQYSWGNQDPAGKNGGNVADLSAKEKYPNWTVFENYRDGFVFTAPVGSFEPNQFGLYDMSGNVWEWCSDWKSEYSSKASTNPTGPTSGSYRVVRGGSWYYVPRLCRVADRLNGAPGDRHSVIGFRLARTK